MKKISVVIPCYNVERWIDRCIASIMAQTFEIRALEIICVDDASTDDTWAHLRKWEQLYPEDIVLIRQEVNRRQGAARNIGLKYACADWIAFIDADDWIERDYFERLYVPAVRYGCDVVFCPYKVDYSKTLTYFAQGERKEDIYLTADTKEDRDRWIGHRILGDSVCGKLIRKSLLTDHQIFFPEGLVYEDMYWAPLLHIYAKSAYKIGEGLYHYFVGDISTVRSPNSNHHIDWITIQLMKWDDYDKRGLLKKYPKELEQDGLNDAASFIKMLVLWYDQPPFSLFLLEREVIRQHVPDYRDNPYLKGCAEIYSVLLDALYCPMNRNDFQKFVNEAKKYWIQ